MRTLARAELLNLRGYMVVGPRDGLFVVALLTMAFFAAAILHGGVEMAESYPAFKPWLATAWGVLCVLSAWIKPGSATVIRLQGGIFHPWLGHGTGLKSWAMVRAVSLGLVAVAATAIMVAVVQVQDVPAFIALAAGGIAIGAGVCYLAFSYTAPAPSPARLRIKRPALTWPGLTGPAWTLVAGRLRRRFGILPAWLAILLLLVLGTAVGGLAAHNNHNPGVGFTIVGVSALIAGGFLTFPDLAMVRLAARQPVSLARLLRLFCLVPLMIVLVLTLVAGLVSGIGPAMAASCAVFVTLALGLWLMLLLPQAMMRSPRGAVGLAAGDLVLALLIKSAALFGLLAVVYLIVRIILNLRAIRRNRWREAG